MVALLSGLLGGIAMAAWVVALLAAIGIYRMMPPGHKLKSFFDLGWLNFDHIHEIAGPEARTLTRRYVWGLVAFFVAIALIMAMTVLMIVQSENAVPEPSPAGLSQISSPLLPTERQET